MIDVQVLGPLRVLVDGRALELGPPRRRALLAAFATEPGRALPLDVLADRVWSGEAPASTTSTVQAYVSRLRQSLRDADPELGDLLRTHAHGYALEVATETVDAQRFAAHLRAAHGQRDAGDTAGARESVGAGLALWRGQAYEDVGAEFARREADRLEELRDTAQELAARLDLELGHHLALADELPGLLERSPLREGLHAAYLLALYRSGRQAEALAHFGVVRALLADELGVDPGPELRALHEQVLRHDPALDAAPARTPTAAAPSAEVPVAAGPRMVGRAAEQAAVRAALAPALDGELAVAAVVGEAGIGKTRLVEEVTAGLAGSFVVAWGRTWEHDGAPALWPWVQAVRELAARLTADELTEALTGRAAGVAALVPELEGETQAPAAEGLDAAQVRLFDAVAAFFETVAQDRPVLVVLEDLHWADQGTTRVLEYLVRHLSRARLGILVTVRWPTDDGSRAGSELLTSLARSGRAARVDLAGLSEEELQSYVEQRTGSRIDGATAEALADRTGGNPFFVSELVRLLVTDDSDPAGGEVRQLPETVPDSIRDVIVRRISRLPDVDQQVLRVAAVVGRTFDLALIQEAAGLDEDDVDEAVDRATALGVLVSDASEAGRHQFVHALTQQTMLETTGPSRRRRLHARVAAALDRRGGAADQLVFHLVQSGGPDELARAVEVSLEVAEDAVARGNYPEAETTLLRALALTGRLSEPAKAEMSVRTRLWSLYMTTAGLSAPVAVAQRQRCVELVKRYGDPHDLLAQQQADWSMHIMAADYAAGSALVVEMEAAGEAADNDLLRYAGLQARLALTVIHHGRPVEALAIIEQIENVLAGIDAVPVVVFPISPAARLLVYRGTALGLVGELSAADAQFAALDALLVDEPPTSRAYASIEVATALALRDDPVAAARWIAPGLALVREHGFVGALPFAWIIDAWARERLEPGRHLAELDEALALSLEVPTMAWRPLLRALVADVRLRAGDLDGAEEQLDAAFADAEQTTTHGADPELHRLRAELADRRGVDPDEVEAERERGRLAARTTGASLFVSRLG